MPTKIFTTIDGQCPFGRKCAIDSQECRKCEWFYRAGTAMFFWCRHPVTQEKERAPKKMEQKPAEIERKGPGMEQEKRKRGRPRKDDVQARDAAMKAAKRGRKPTKGKERPIMVIKQVKR